MVSRWNTSRDRRISSAGVTGVEETTNPCFSTRKVCPAQGQHPLGGVHRGAGKLVHVGLRALFKEEKHRVKVPVNLGFQGKGLDPLPVTPRPALDWTQPKKGSHW